MKSNNFYLRLAIIASFCLPSTLYAAQDGYGNITPTEENTGANYPNTNNNTNPYIDYTDSTLLNPYGEKSIKTPISKNYAVGQQTSSYTENISITDALQAQAYNFEGNNLTSTKDDRSAISASGIGANVVFYKNNANYISLSAYDHASLFIDANTAAGATIAGDNAFILIKNNYADNATISNSNQSTMIIDGNAVSGAVLTNDNSTMKAYHNTAVGATINNINGASLTALGNNISNSNITNTAGSTLTIGDCDRILCADAAETIAQGIELNNQGDFYFSGNINLNGSTVNNNGLFSGTGNINLASSTLNNTGTISITGTIKLDNSLFDNSGSFTLANADVNLTNTSITNSGDFSFKDVSATGGTFNNVGKLTITGVSDVSLDVNNNSKVKVTNDSSIDLHNSSFINQTDGNVELYNNTKVTGDITNYGHISLASNDSQMVRSTLSGDFTNYGTLSLASSDSTVGNQITVDGDYIGHSGSQIVMNSILGADNSLSDNLHITGNSAGSSAVYVNNIGGLGAQTIEGMNVITVDGNSGAQFTQGSRIVAGAYDYSLVQGSGANTGHWYLTSKDTTPVEPTPVDPTPTPVDPTPPTPPVDPTPSADHERPEAGSYIANIAAANTIFTSSLADRQGNTHYRDPLTGEEKMTSMWMRNIGGHSSWHSTSGQLKTQSNQYVLQLGGDIGKWTISGKDSLTLGVMTGYANNKSKTRSSVSGYSSKGSVNGYSVGLYGTWYSDAATKSGIFVDTWAQYNWFNNSVKGNSLSNESYHSKGLTASVETGFALKISDFDSSLGGESSWYVQPQVQAIWMGVKSGDHIESNGTRVKSEGDGNVQTRLGIKTYLSGRSGLDAKDNRLFQPFIEANWVHNTDTFTTRMNNELVSQAGARNQGEVRVGVESKLTQRLNVWGNIGTSIGDKGYNNSSATLGVKYLF